MSLETCWPGSSPSSLPGSPPASLADVLGARRDDILHHWVERLREEQVTEPRARSVLESHLGDYLQELATALHRTGQDGAAAVPEESNVAREHGRQCLCIGFSLAVLAREYGVLHECILDSIEQTGARVTLAELRALATFIIHGIADAADEYTRQRDASQRLKEVQLHELLDHAPAAIYAKDAEGRFIVANRYLQEQMGHSLEEILGQDDFAFFSKELAGMYRAHDAQVLAGQSCVIEEESFHQTLGPRMYLSTKFPLGGNGGTPTAIGGISTDITERKESEAVRARLLREAEAQRERLDSILQQQLPAYILVMQGPEHIITLANPITRQRLGGREMLGKPMREALPEFVDQGYGELLDNVYRMGKPIADNEVPVWLYPPGGGAPEELFFNYVYAPTHGSDGQVDGVFVHAVEVTELVRERRRAEEALALLDTLLTTAPVAMSFLDRDLRYVRVNQMLADVLGLPIERILGHRLEELSPSFASQHTPHRRQVLETGQPVFGVELTGTLAAMDGEIHHWLCNHAPVRNRAGEVILVATVALDITERKRAESATEERFRLLVEGVEDYAIFMLDPKGRVTSWNPGAERIKGWKASEVLGRSLSRFYLPGDVVAGVPEQALQLAATEGQYRAEMPLVRKDGSQFWADVLLTALRDERGNLRGFAMITRDISPRRQTEEALRATTQRMQAILETAVDGIITIDEWGRIQSINPATECIFGRSPEKLLGHDFLHLLPEPYLSGNIEPGGCKLLGSGREVKGCREDGSLFPLELSVSETRLSQGRFFTCIVRDISARKHAEEAQALFIQVGTLLSQSLDVLTTLKSLASLVVTHLADYCLVDLLGEDGKLRRLEVAARDPERQQLIRRSMPPSLQLDVSALLYILEGGVPVAEPEPSPEWLDALSGSTKQHPSLLESLGLKSLVLVPLMARERKLGLISFAWSQPRSTCSTTDLEVARGVAERAAMALDNARLYQDAQAAIRVREDVVAIVSHDLRTPLNAISLSATSLLNREGVDERTSKAATRIRAAADRASRMIRDLLDFNQARMRGLPVHCGPLDFHAHVLRVVREVRVAHPDRYIGFHASGEGQGQWDGDRLAQVVTNLVGNAIQHSPEGSSVRVSTRSEGSSVLLEVHNENAGHSIPPEVLSHLFEPYRRGAEAGAGQGSLGLGLFITQEIVHAHDGSIHVHSTPEEGTTFTVRLPRQPVQR
ncbi:PAS domain-containing protein [Archangium sp. Cb G35]|uniref:PAS domain-containing protein n=1 Tax=Archangium sp. Cb G35 TaxID=1920190 RepID=UPI000937825E|nr:PAS domain-containing protein [Archangium sp. Cb G35]